MNLNECSVIKLYELKYIDQETFFSIVTGCGEQTEYEDGLDRLIYYLKLVANRDKNGNESMFEYFIPSYCNAKAELLNLTE